MGHVTVAVSDKQVALLVEAVRFLIGNGHNREDARLCEDGVHLLERAITRLGEEEIDDRKDEGVDNGEDDVGLVANIGKRNRRNLLKFQLLVN